MPGQMHTSKSALPSCPVTSMPRYFVTCTETGHAVRPQDEVTMTRSAGAVYVSQQVRGRQASPHLEHVGNASGVHELVLQSPHCLECKQ